jgi:RNA polymerase sigma-70 factor, ECF subfamily
MTDLDALIAANDRSLRALAYRLLGDASAMDDVLQEAYLKAFRGFARFRGESSATTWLYRIVYNACIDERRRRKPAASIASDVPAIDSLATVDDRDELARALATLAPADRAAVLLVDAFGFDYAAAARVLGVAPGTIGSRLARARSALKAALAREGVHHA